MSVGSSWRAGLAGLIALMCAPTCFAATILYAPILFPRGTAVPRPVQAFAWRVIESRCNYQSYEREQRLFWAYRAQARQVDATRVYSVSILSERTWKRSEPPATIEMTIVDDGGLRLEALQSTFVVCTAEQS